MASHGRPATQTAAAAAAAAAAQDRPAKVRSVDFLTPEQLRRKREGDRLSQKHARQRTKALIEHLQQRVHDLETRNSSLAQELSAALCPPGAPPAVLPGPPAVLPGPLPAPGHASRCPLCGGGPAEDSSSSSSVGSASVSSASSASSALVPDDKMAAPWPEPEVGRLRPDDGTHLEATLNQMITDNFPGLDFTMWTGAVPFDDKAAAEPFLSPPVFPYGSPSPPPPPPTGFPAPRAKVWATLPPHLPGTCRLDEVVFGLLRARRPLERTGGNAAEFQRQAFPSVQSLLNPAARFVSAAQARAQARAQAAQAARSPVSTTIVNEIIQVMTVPKLPEQIAILYVMSTVVRWLIAPTEANYESMPAWLRPSPAQLVEPHPPWIDLFAWPRGRDRLVRDPRYHDQHGAFNQYCIQTISINWPHELADMILLVNGTEYVLNPIFARHIQNIDNWSMGREVLQSFPDFANDLNIK